ncbi:MAG: glycoside hydrolase family 9 protein [Bacteroidales bacterium]|nr:glycoside hydrolase family 9 protein [Bacteroidales bacterium]MBN2699227.1 glycoside hydrolase family 9 protein [Bacteroidales bacterium]
MIKKLLIAGLFSFSLAVSGQSLLRLNSDGYFEMDGLNVMFFSDFYPEGHQSGVTIIQHGNRVAANGDLRLEPSPGQWSPVPAGGKVRPDPDRNSISKILWFPDSSRNRRGFNPIYYPDLSFDYEVHVVALEKSSFKIVVDLKEPLPASWVGRVGFNLELFPGDLFGKTYLMDGKPGLFPRQPSGPLTESGDGFLTEPLAVGNSLVIAPEQDVQRMVISSSRQPLELLDGRSNHNNGWYIVRSSVPAGATEGAIEWIVTPNAVPEYTYSPVIQVSRMGYHPMQKKRAVLETDRSDDLRKKYTIYRLTGTGKEVVKEGFSDRWGRFLRYHYEIIDFSDLKSPGIYRISCEGVSSGSFVISDEVYERNSWQPTLEYFLPIQMCHMRVNEKYRVWHDLCHMDDALMAPLNHNHFDGYRQGNHTLTDFKPGESVPGLNRGGWHDAGDYDLRVESQIGTVWMLALMIEEFGLNHDATLVDPENRVVEIHVPDGRSDAIQQIEHGLASVLGAYRSMGRLYRGIICSNLRQYVMLGDAASMTDNNPWEGSPAEIADFSTHFPNVSAGIQDHPGGPSFPDDRLVFTEENPSRELFVAAGLAAASRVLRTENPGLSAECLQTALFLWKEARDKTENISVKAEALSELILATDSGELKKELISMQDAILRSIDECGWAVGHVINHIDHDGFRAAMALAVKEHQQALRERQLSDSPYGVPYRPNIWGAGWNIQRFGVEQYFFLKGWPEFTGTEMMENALHFILGVHPGPNTASFASGIGSRSVTVAYGTNRADWSFIPGGVVSGTALIRPDLPELKVWPYLWQQTEYVIGGGATNFMFLVLAVDKICKQKPEPVPIY